MRSSRKAAAGPRTQRPLPARHSSPTTEEPKVDWKRSRITVKPREGWRPDRVYRVELLPGVMDLRNNRSDERRVLTFTTGAPVPTRR